MSSWRSSKPGRSAGVAVLFSALNMGFPTIVARFTSALLLPETPIPHDQFKTNRKLTICVRIWRLGVLHELHVVVVVLRRLTPHLHFLLFLLFRWFVVEFENALQRFLTRRHHQVLVLDGGHCPSVVARRPVVMFVVLVFAVAVVVVVVMLSRRGSFQRTRHSDVAMGRNGRPIVFHLLGFRLQRHTVRGQRRGWCRLVPERRERQMD
jgi:hypothetical protein